MVQGDLRDLGIAPRVEPVNLALWRTREFEVLARIERTFAGTGRVERLGEYLFQGAGFQMINGHTITPPARFDDSEDLFTTHDDDASSGLLFRCGSYDAEMLPLAGFFVPPDRDFRGSEDCPSYAAVRRFARRGFRAPFEGCDGVWLVRRHSRT